MGTFRSGLWLVASLIAASPAFAQVALSAENPPPAGLSVEQPAAQPPVLPASVAPEVDPNFPASTVTPAVAPPAVSIPASPKPKPAAPQLPTARGAVSAINKTAYTVTLDVKGKPQVFKITSKTRIFSETKPAIFGDAKVGDKAVIEYRNAKDKSKEALTLRLGGAATDPTRAAANPKKPSIKKKAAAKAKPAIEAPAVAPAATETPIVPDSTAPGTGVAPIPSGPAPNP